MDQTEARAVLGVTAGAAADEVRAAFRRRLHRAHPDIAPGDPHAARDTSRLVEAYAVLRSGGAAPSPPPKADRVAWPPEARPGGRPRRPEVEGDSVTWDRPADEVFRRLVEVADRIGDITYLDPAARLLDTVVVVDDVACSLLATLQGRAAGTEVFLTLEPLGNEGRPAIGPVVAAVAALLGDDADG